MTLRVMRALHTSSKAVAAASVEAFKARLHGDCSNLGWWKVFLPIAGWNWMVFRVPPNPNHSVMKRLKMDTGLSETPSMVPPLTTQFLCSQLASMSAQSENKHFVWSP